MFVFFCLLVCRRFYEVSGFINSHKYKDELIHDRHKTVLFNNRCEYHLLVVGKGKDFRNLKIER